MLSVCSKRLLSYGVQSFTFWKKCVKTFYGQISHHNQKMRHLNDSEDERLKTTGRRKLLQYYKALVKLVALGIRKEGLYVRQMSTGPLLIFNKSCYSDDQQLATLSFHVYPVFLLLNSLNSSLIFIQEVPLSVRHYDNLGNICQ